MTLYPSEGSSNSARPRRTKSTLGGNSEEGSRTPSNRPESSRTASNLASRDSRRRTRSKNNEEWSVPEEEPEMPLANVATSLSFGPRGTDGRMKTEGLRATAMGFGFSTEQSEGPAVPSTPGGFQSEGDKSIDGLGVSPTKSTVSKVRSKISVAHQEDDGFEAINFVEPEPGHWDLNRSGVIPVSVFVGLWTACACGVLFAMVYIYRFQEVLKSYQLAEESALAHARLVAADLLLPTVGAVDAVQASLAGGVLRDLSDYGTVLRILRPHFASRKILEEVELAAPPNASGISPGSVLLKRIGDEVKLLTDRDDCEEVPGRRGCIQTLSARTDDWYRDGFGIDKAWTYVPPEQFWSGPLFIRVDKDLTVCPQLCWKPAFMFVKRATITGGPKAVISGIATSDQPATGSTLNTVLVRVVVSAEIFQEVVDTAVSLSLGEAIVATANGDVVAAKDMSSAVLIDEETGNLQVNKVWEAKNRWAGAASEEMVSRGQGVYAESGAYSVSVRGAWNSHLRIHGSHLVHLDVACLRGERGTDRRVGRGGGVGLPPTEEEKAGVESGGFCQSTSLHAHILLRAWGGAFTAFTAFTRTVQPAPHAAREVCHDRSWKDSPGKPAHQLDPSAWLEGCAETFDTSPEDH